MIRPIARRRFDLAGFAPVWILVASVTALATALAAQYLGGLTPCALCHHQRWPYVAAVCVSALALATGRDGVRRTLVALCGLAFVAGAGLAAYHVAVEQGWAASPAACGGGDAQPATMEELRRRLLAAPIVRCDAVAWSMFGISFAGYNLIASTGLAAASLAAAVRRKRRRT